MSNTKKATGRILPDVSAETAALLQRIKQLEEEKAALAVNATKRGYGEPKIDAYEGNAVFVIPHASSTEKFRKLDIRIGFKKAQELWKHKGAFEAFVKSEGKKIK